VLAFSGLAASGQHYLPQLPNFPRLISHWEVVTSPGQHDGRLGRRWLVLVVGRTRHARSGRAKTPG